MEQKYNVALTEAEIELLVHSLEVERYRIVNAGPGPIAGQRSSSNPGVRATYELEDKLYTALLAEYSAQMSDRAAAAAAYVLAHKEEWTS